ncbi:hypothetical protein RB195_014729 [Necator americanus]|uniref:Uncharacterized protein n=1 Tax=Necator americanus TaxID=51031 RepID=A0ABR1E1C4_NECAM
MRESAQWQRTHTTSERPVPSRQRVEDPSNKHCTHVYISECHYSSDPQFVAFNQMQTILFATLAVSVVFAQFVPQPQNYVPQQQQYLQNQPARFSQYSNTNYNTGYNTQYGQTGYTNSYNSNGYGTTTPSYYSANNNNQFGYTTTQYGMNRQFDQNGMWNGVATSTALMAVATTAIAFVL